MIGGIIDACIDRSRAVFLILALIFVLGFVAYANVPKEQSPDVKIPIIYVSVNLEGISPDDAERMIIRPLEQELRSIEGLKELRANATQGRASVVLEFIAGFDSTKALDDVREKVDIAKPDLPEEAEEPIITEVNFSLFPVLNVILTGNVPERTLLKLARRLRDDIESIPEVLDVDIAGNREEALEIVIEPLLLESYGVGIESIDLVRGNNTLVAAGSLEGNSGDYNVKVPGLLETLEDVLNLPLKVNGDAVVTVSDIASVNKTFKDPEGFARANGVSALVLEVSKRTGENIIETIDKVRAVVEREKAFWPEGIEVTYSQDQSDKILDMLNDLQNNILFAMILVMIVIIAAVGLRSASLVAISIPGAFLIGIIAIYLMGFTLNIVVLFSLILSIGLLVDSSVVVTEFADRKVMDDVPYTRAYSIAAKRMSWPIIASTATTLAVFMPLLFWPGVVGQFMKYMPITLIVTLTGSMLMALIFVPALGTHLGKGQYKDDDITARVHQAEHGDIYSLPGFTGGYIKLLNKVVQHAGKFSVFIFTLLLFVYFLYAVFSAGVEFFPNVEPDNAQVQIRARGNLSVYEKDRLVKEVETRIADLSDEIRVFYARSGVFDSSNQQLAEDVIGVIQMEFTDWKKRRKASQIQEDIRKRTANIGGVIIEVREEEKGPPVGKPVQLEIRSRFPEKLEPTVEKILSIMDDIGGFKDIEDSRPVPGIEWQMVFDREQAVRFGLTAQAAGEFVKLVTNGLKITTYRPDDADDEVDVLLRYPNERRSLDQLDHLRAITTNGAIPVGNFVTREAKPKVTRIERVDQRRVMTIKADIEEGVLADEKVKAIANALQNLSIDPDVTIVFKGEDEEQQEASSFLSGAFILALFAMALILVIQFNSIYHMIIIMSAVFLSTVGVLLGLLVTQQPFGIVMCGVGIISLAGIVVNNNIIFIDTYKLLRAEGMEVKEALMRTGAQRLRPILLTAFTTVLGLLPMVAAVTIDFIGREVSYGAPSTQWWRQLSTTIAGGLSFATILTLFFTPALIMLGERWFVEKSNQTQL